MNLTDRTAALQEIYAAVPDPHCKGLCDNSCTAIPMTVHEARLLRRNGTPLPHAETFLVNMLNHGATQCPALVDGQCTVYELRPLICRLYGAVEDMRCEHGCVPDEGFLTKGQARALIDAARLVGGGDR